jgi:hypothetical protein
MLWRCYRGTGSSDCRSTPNSRRVGHETSTKYSRDQGKQKIVNDGGGRYVRVSGEEITLNPQDLPFKTAQGKTPCEKNNSGIITPEVPQRGSADAQVKRTGKEKLSSPPLKQRSKQKKKQYGRGSRTPENSIL